MTDVDFMLGGCGKECIDFVVGNFGRLGEYIGSGDLMAAILNATRDEYEREIRKTHKGMWAAITRAERMGYFCDLFVYENHIPDICEINHSKEARCGGPMRESYLRSIEELGGYPKEKQEFSPPRCRLHARYLWGVFRDIPGYRQGEVQIGRQLLGYISFIRFGTLGIYSQILGHGDFLKDGIMPWLHLNIVRWCRELGVGTILYDSWVNAESLQDWKRRLFFEPDRLEMAAK